MMNKLMKKMVVALTAGTIAIAATSVAAYAGMDGHWDEESSIEFYDEYVAPEALGCNFDNGYVAPEALGYDFDDEYVAPEALGECEYTSVITPDMYEYTTRIVSVPSGYLALRTTPHWTDDDSNVLEEMYSGEVFTITEYSTNGQYAYGFSHTTGTWGWVNDDYLVMNW